eukprot:GAHX01003650.1.p1 GENE.GAHX01003650.1~~GAHX01003650.1.p1  ORF type:complete len:414 (+),score=110.29 GAHX01003650.1:217-1458(+)
MKKIKPDSDQNKTLDIYRDVKEIKKQFLKDQSLRQSPKDEIDIKSSINKYETYSKLKPNSIKNWLNYISSVAQLGNSSVEILRLYFKAISVNPNNELIWSKFLLYCQSITHNLNKEDFIKSVELLWFHLKDNFKLWSLVFNINHKVNFIDQTIIVEKYLDHSINYNIYKAYLETLCDDQKMIILDKYYEKFTKQIKEYKVNNLDDLYSHFPHKEIDSFIIFFEDVLKYNFKDNCSVNNFIEGIKSLFIYKISFFNNAKLFVKFERHFIKENGKLCVLNDIIKALQINAELKESKPKQIPKIIENNVWDIEIFQENKTFQKELNEKDLYTILNFLKEMLYKTEENEKENKNMDLYYLTRLLILAIKMEIFQNNEIKIKEFKNNYLTIKLTKLKEIKDDTLKVSIDNISKFFNTN